MLFVLGPAPRSSLAGIARLAAEARPLPSKARVEYRDLTSRTIVNRCSNPRMPFRWTINPYRGCEIGCRYCYARYTHDFMGLDPGQGFEERIFAKADVAELLRRDLRKVRRGAIAIGTSTDPYQPAERRFERTRAILEVFAAERGREIGLTTKSDLVVRDLDRLVQVAERNRMTVNVTVTTTDAALARKLEPRAPRPELRLAAVAELCAAGLRAGVFAGPAMPGITDSQANLNAVAAAAAAAGATHFSAGALYLTRIPRETFLPFVEREFPMLAGAYRREFGAGAYLRDDYAEKIRERVRRARESAGLASTPYPALADDDPQMSLFD